MLRTIWRCVQSPNISVDVVKCVETFHKFTQYTHFFSVTKNDLFRLNNLLMIRFQLIRMSSYAKNKVHTCSVSVDVAKLGETFHKFTQYTHFFSVTKNDLSSLNNLFIVMFLLTSMSSYAKIKLQMCSVAQHQCRRR